MKVDARSSQDITYKINEAELRAIEQLKENYFGTSLYCYSDEQEIYFYLGHAINDSLFPDSPINGVQIKCPTTKTSPFLVNLNAKAIETITREGAVSSRIGGLNLLVRLNQG